MKQEDVRFDDKFQGVLRRKPNPIKLFLADLAYFYTLPQWGNEILFALLMKMNEAGEIIINMGIKKRIALELGMNVASIKNAICIYHKKGILIRQAEGIYLANPSIFGKGEWKDGGSISLEVRYNQEDGIRVIIIEIEKSKQALSIEGCLRKDIA